jgi:hypothetical protein
MVGTATYYRLDSLGFKPQWVQAFMDPSRPAPRPTQPPVQWVPGLLPGGKVAGAWC